MKFSAFALLLLFAPLSRAQENVPLYSGAIPNAIEAPDEESIRDPKERYQFLLNISRPALSIYLPKRIDVHRTSVIILPGGSYRGVSIIKEGRDVALAFNEMGVAAFVVKYRTPSDRHMRDRTSGPVQDVRQALTLVHAKAKEWNIEPTRVGVVGFSAGGHLATLAATQFDDELRPAFLAAIYPVISMTDPFAHALSRSNLLGDAPSAELIHKYSLEFSVTSKTPPTFLVHAADDKSVPVENTLRFFDALHAYGVSAELHIYPRGGHGFGLNNSTTPDRWIDHCRNWLVSQGLLAR